MERTQKTTLTIPAFTPIVERGTLLPLRSVSLLSKLVLFKQKMTSAGFNLYLQQGAGNYEDNEGSDHSQQSEDSQNSQETNSPQEKTAVLNPWSRILHEAEQGHDAQLNALINESEGNGDSQHVAGVKAENTLVPVYRKGLRKVVRVSAVDASNKERFHLPKSD